MTVVKEGISAAFLSPVIGGQETTIVYLTGK
jgi:hypothetical protein